MMNPISQYPFIRLNDLLNEPIVKSLGSFNFLASSYGLEPFKLVTSKNSILTSRFKIAGNPFLPINNNFYLSVLLVKTSISLDEVNDFVIDLAATKKLSHAALSLYKNVFQRSSKDDCRSGKDWAFKQARLGQRLLLSIAEDTGIEVKMIENFDRKLFNEVLALDENKWEIFSVFVLRVKIKISPAPLLNTTFGLN